MNDLPVPALPVPALHIDGGGLFPVRRIFCVGQNYAGHVREMGGNPDRDPPFFFSKPADAVLVDDEAMPYPARTTDLHHEVELVVAIGKSGADIAVDNAIDHVWGYTVGLDMTRRDLQAAAKAERRPWDMAKGFDCSAPTGALVPASRIGHPASGTIALQVNGEIRQSADLDEMIWSIPEIIAELSTYVRLEPGDLIFTGTPEGVGPVERGDRIDAAIAGVGKISVTIA